MAMSKRKPRSEAHLSSLATAVGMAYTNADFDVDDEWCWDGTGPHQTAHTDIQDPMGGVLGPICDAHFEPSHLEGGAEAEVRYDYNGVYIDLEATGEDARLAMSGVLTNEQARELAVGLWQAAKERDWRDEGEPDE